MYHVSAQALMSAWYTFIIIIIIIIIIIKQTDRLWLPKC